METTNRGFINIVYSIFDTLVVSVFSRSAFSRSVFSRSGFSRSVFSRSVFSRSGVWGLGFRGLCFRDTPLRLLKTYNSLLKTYTITNLKNHVLHSTNILETTMHTITSYQLPCEQRPFDLPR